MVWMRVTRRVVEVVLKDVGVLEEFLEASVDRCLVAVMGDRRLDADDLLLVEPTEAPKHLPRTERTTRAMISWIPGLVTDEVVKHSGDARQLLIESAGPGKKRREQGHAVEMDESTAAILRIGHTVQHFVDSTVYLLETLHGERISAIPGDRIRPGAKGLGLPARIEYRRSMRRIDWVRVVFALLADLTLFASGSFAQTLSLDGTGEALAVAVFSEFGLSATLEGEARWSGTVAADAGTVSLVANGSLQAVAVYGFVDLILEGWLAFEASGATTDGTAAEVRGLLYLKTETIGMLRSGESISGTHYTLIDVGGAPMVFHGSFVGSATGGVVPSDTPRTIQAEGSGSVRLSGAGIDPSDEFLAGIPLDHGALTSEFVESVRALLLSRKP